MIERINRSTIIETISPGKYRAIIGVRNYKADTGKWEPVIDDIKTDLTLVGSKIGVDKVNLCCRFPETLDAPLRVFDREGNRADILFKGLAFRNIKTGDLTYLPSRKSKPEVIIGGTRIHYNEVYTGVRLSYQQRDGSIKEEITISEATRASFSSPYPIKDTHLVVVSQVTNVVGIVFPLGTYSFRDVEFPDFPLQRYKDSSLIIDGVELEKVLDVTRFPGDLTIDPTATLYDDDTSRGQYLRYTDVSYLTVRSAASAELKSSTSIVLGQFINGSYQVYRIYSNFDLSGIPGGSTVTSATIDYYGSNNQSVVDFDYGIYDSGQPGTIVNSDYSSFPGWQSGSQTYTPTAWSNKINTSAYALGYGNVLTFNATGKTAIETNIGGEFQVLVLSDEDINYSTPSNKEYVLFHGSGDASKAKLIVDYDIPSGYTHKVMGVAAANMAKVDGVAKANIAKVLGV